MPTTGLYFNGTPLVAVVMYLSRFFHVNWAKQRTRQTVQDYNYVFNECKLGT